MGTDDVDDPVRGKGCDAEDDEEGKDVVSLLAELLGPLVKTVFPLWNGEERGAKGSADEVAQCGAGCDARASEGEGDGDTPDCTAQDGQIHGARKGEGLDAARTGEDEEGEGERTYNRYVMT